MKTQQRRTIAEINVVPYIDVMLVLLVIFMITAPLLSQGVNVELPKATSKPLTEEQEPLVVSIDAQGQYFLNSTKQPDQPIDAPTLQTNVAQELEHAKQHGVKRNVLVKGDKRVDYDKVMQAMVLLQQAGAESVGLVTQNP